MEALACGRIGLDILYLYTLTSRQFSNIQAGWNAQQEMYTKTSWEQTRTLYDAVIRPHLKDKEKSAKDILPFPWDKEIEVVKSAEIFEEKSYEEMEARWAELDRCEVVDVRKI